MNLKKLAVSALLLGSVSAAQATTYDVHGLFNETMTNGSMTEFVGSFDWNESTKMVSNFSGTMNESMRGNWTTGMDYVDGTPVPTFGSYNYMVGLASDGGASYNQSATAGLAQATVYHLPGDSAVFAPGGTGFQSYMPNTENASFKLVFGYDLTTGAITTTGLQNVSNVPAANPSLVQSSNSPLFTPGLGNLNPTLVNTMAYGDCTLGSMMMMHSCMAGEVTGTSMMKATPWALQLTQVSAVPLPAAAWLFGGALMSLFGANRRKRVLPA